MLSPWLAKASVAFDNSIRWNFLYLLLIFQCHLKWHSVKSFIVPLQPYRSASSTGPQTRRLFFLSFLCFPFSKREQSTYNIIFSFHFLVLLSLECILLGSPWKGSFICWITLKGGWIVPGPACMGILQLMEDVSVELSGKRNLSFFKLYHFIYFS